MKVYLRIILALIVSLGTFFFIYWIPFAQLTSQDTIAISVTILISLIVGVFVWIFLGQAKSRRWLYVYFGGFIIGSISFILGYLGPGFFNPSSTQGPYLGLFITGPIGFIMGLMAGGLYWLYKNRKKDEDNITSQ